MPLPEKKGRNKEIFKKHKQGWSLREIGDFYHLHHSTVDNVIKRLSVFKQKQVKQPI